MKITEKMLLDGYDCKSKGGDNMSIISGETIWWTYRTGLRNDGYNPVCSRERASEITLCNDREGTIKMDVDNDTHEALQQIESDEAKLWGNEI